MWERGKDGRGLSFVDVAFRGENGDEGRSGGRGGGR